MRNILPICLSILMTSISFASDTKSTDQEQDEMKRFSVPEYLKLFKFDGTPGHQILHAKSTNKHYENCMAAYQFVAERMTKAKDLSSDAAVFRYASDSVNKGLQEIGFFVEVGIYLPRTTNALAFLNPKKTIYGIISEQGIEEDWEKEPGRIIKKGTFAFDPSLINAVTCSNIRYYKGTSYLEVLTAFKDNILKRSPLALLNLHTHTYGTTKTVLDTFGTNIVPNTVITADALYNYPNYHNHVWKALKEFAEKAGYGFEFIAFNSNHEQAALKVKEKS